MKGRTGFRLDLGIAGLVTAVATGFRFWGITGLGLTHFDEGAYAATGRWIATWGAEGWPFQAGQSPGLFPVLLGAMFHLFGIRDWVAISVSAAAGSLTVGALYWIGRNWFDRTAGLSAALLAATCQYHLIYSRLALTDALFSLFFWVALALLFAGVESGRRWRLVVGGLVTALAWNTKYHGFFPLAISVVWVASHTLWNRVLGAKPSPGAEVNLRSLVPAAVVAVVGMVPWIAAVGVSLGWGPILGGFFDHTAGGGGFPLTAPATLGFYLNRWMGWPPLLLALLGLVLIVLQRERAGLFLWLANSTILIGALFYLSFPRLILPAVLGLCLSAGYAISQLARAFAERREWVVAIVLSPILWANIRDGAPTLSMRTDCYRVAALFLESQSETVLTQMSKNFYFYGGKPFVEMRFESLQHLDELDRGNQGLVVAFDPIIRRFPQLRAWVRARQTRLRLIREIPIEAYEPIFYQGIDPFAERGHAGTERAFAPGSSIRVYQLRAGDGRPR